MPDKKTNLSNHRPLILGLAAVAVFLLYGAIVFIGEALLFALYQFLRDRGYGYWSATLMVTLMFCILAIPTIFRRILK